MKKAIPLDIRALTSIEEKHYNPQIARLQFFNYLTQCVERCNVQGLLKMKKKSIYYTLTETKIAQICSGFLAEFT